jgi:Flp pilus assembly protein TadG
MRRRVLELIGVLTRDRRGGVAIAFSLALLPVICIVGLALDFSSMTRQRSILQSAADAGALSAARELHLAQVGSTGVVANMAHTYTNAALSKASSRLSHTVVNVNLLNNNSSVEVAISATYKAIFFPTSINIAAKAVASAMGFPICGLTLDPSAPQSIYLRTQSQVTAQFCAVQANSIDKEALYTQGSSQMTAASICSGGGVNGKFFPAPITDCPAIPDPLASRPAPSVGPCTYTDLVVNGGTLALTPGNYCGGLYVTGGAFVTLTAGEHIMSGGKLKVDNASTLVTSGGSIYLTAGATLWFGSDTTINMTAPTGGPLAGLLVYEDHNAPPGQVHYIYSNNAPVLHGTIYLPANQLWVETSADVSKASAFTIIVARSLHVDKAANLWLNSNYNLSNVPVPGGLKPGVPFLAR